MLLFFVQILLVQQAIQGETSRAKGKDQYLIRYLQRLQEEFQHMKQFPSPG